MLIRISAPVSVTREVAPVADHDTIAAITASRSSEQCSDHLTNELADAGVTGGTVTLAYDAESAGFRVVTEFVVPEHLNEAEMGSLVEQTQGQWSDGIGEHCFGDLCRRHRLDLDLCTAAADVRAEQIDDGVSRPRPPSALFQAVRAGDVDATRKLLDGGADIEARSRGSTLLLMAISGGRADLALELLRRGADPTAVNDTGIDALMWTALSNRMPDAGAAAVARALLTRLRTAPVSGALDVNAPRDRHTPLYMARNRKKAALVDVLVEFGASDADARPGPAA